MQELPALPGWSPIWARSRTWRSTSLPGRNCHRITSDRLLGACSIFLWVAFCPERKREEEGGEGVGDESGYAGLRVDRRSRVLEIRAIRLSGVG